jgi:hypothetical protein
VIVSDQYQVNVLWCPAPLFGDVFSHGLIATVHAQANAVVEEEDLEAGPILAKVPQAFEELEHRARRDAVLLWASPETTVPKPLVAVPGEKGCQETRVSDR